eukprot:s63_g51.t1
MASEPEFTLVLSDSTGYGWLPGKALGGTALVVREEINGVAAVVCSGSLVKAGTAGPCALDVIMKDWVLQGAVTAFAAERAVEVGIIPARESVPRREYEALKLARTSFQVPETPRPILSLVGEAYGRAQRPLHFVRAEAEAAMDTLVKATVEDMKTMRKAAAGAEHRSAPGSAAEHRSAADGRWIAVVVCAGWNCVEKEVLAEAFVAARLARCRAWAETLQVLSAHATVKLPWRTVAPCLKEAPKTLWQTCNQDHAESKRTMGEFAAGLRREFVDDGACEADVVGLGGQVLLAKYLSWTKPAHRADLWRYIRLCQQGGYYMDIKMCLLRPLDESLRDIYEDGNRRVATWREAAGQRIAQPAPERQSIAQPPEAVGQRIAQPPQERQRIAQPPIAATSAAAPAEDLAPPVLDVKLEEQPHLIMSRGANQAHVYQGNILACSPEHPLIVRAIGDCLTVAQGQLQNRYLRFCEFLWKEMERDLGQKPTVGWNFCPSLGPIYLLEEKLVRQGREKLSRAKTATGEEIPVDGHLMHIAHSGVPYAATRAWGWKNKFLDVALTALAVNQAAAAEQSIAQSALEQSIAQSSTTAGGGAAVAEATPAAEAEVMATEVTPDLLAECLRVAAASRHYADLVEAEVTTLAGLGLRPAITQPEWLSCVRCKNRKRQEYKFLGTNEVRQHFQGHGEVVEPEPVAAEAAAANAMEAAVAEGEATVETETSAAAPPGEAAPEPSEPVRQGGWRAGVWREPDAAGREAAAKVELPVVTRGRRLLADVQSASGEVADFFVKVAAVVVHAVAEDRRALARALLSLNPVPRSLQSIAQQRSGPSSWSDVTGEENVKWAVHGCEAMEPQYGLAIVQGAGFAYVKSSLYGTIVMKMVMAACEDTLGELPDSERQLGYRAVCLQVNTALEAAENTARLLESEAAARPWKFDLDPFSSADNYGGKRKRLTHRQQATAKLEGRSARVLSRPSAQSIAQRRWGRLGTHRHRRQTVRDRGNPPLCKTEAGTSGVPAASFRGRGLTARVCSEHTEGRESRPHESVDTLISNRAKGLLSAALWETRDTLARLLLRGFARVDFYPSGHQVVARTLRHPRQTVRDRGNPPLCKTGAGTSGVPAASFEGRGLTARVCGACTEGREAAARVELPVVTRGRRLLAGVQSGTGDVADFFVKVAAVVVHAVAADRRALATALLSLNPAPRSLQSIAQQRHGPSSWLDVTAEENVKWAVHGCGAVEPQFALAIVQGESFAYVRSSLYGTIVMKMVMAGCEETLGELPDLERQLGHRAVCLQVNTALEAAGNNARLLMSDAAARPWKFDLDPFSATGNYGGRRQRLTHRQTATALAGGRSARVIRRR